MGRRSRDPFETTGASTREDAHDAESDVEQSQRIGDESAHATHATDGAEHARG